MEAALANSTAASSKGATLPTERRTGFTIPFGFEPGRWAPVAAAAIAFALLYAEPFQLLLRDWWNDSEAGHGLLLGPLALYLAYRKGLVAEARPQRLLGIGVLSFAVLLRYTSGLAAELYTMRMSMLIAVAGLVVFSMGWRQIRRWWLPATLLVLSIPLPAIVLSTMAFPLQLKASQMGAALLEMRHVPVALRGNVLYLPGQTLFVTEACSGLRSLTALVSLGVLVGGLWLRSPLARIALVAVAVPVAMVLNGVRIFLTGFLVFFVSPDLGKGFMHYTEGWIIFVLAFLILGAMAWALVRVEDVWRERHG